MQLLNFDADTEKIKELLEKAIFFSRDNYDLQQQCVPVALRLDTARTILKRLTNEGYSLEINGKLLSLIYNRYDCDREAYGILVNRIGKENTITWLNIKLQYHIAIKSGAYANIQTKGRQRFTKI